jgi:hypothetical protein
LELEANGDAGWRLGLTVGVLRGAEAGDVGAIHLMGEGSEGMFAFEGEAGMMGEELVDLFLVFLRFEAAGAVDEDSARFEGGGAAAQQGGLESAEALDFLGADAPAQIDTAPQDAGIGAGGIDEDAMEPGVAEAGDGGGERAGWFWGEEMGGDAGGSESGTILAEQGESIGVDIAGEDAGLIGGELCEESGFATGRGAEVEDSVAGLGFEGEGSEEGAGILDVEGALLEAGQVWEGRMSFEFEHVVFRDPVMPDEVVGDIFLAPLEQELAGRASERIHAGERGGGDVIPLEELLGDLAAPALEPAGAEPLWVGIAQVRLTGFEAVDECAGNLPFPAVGAEDGVDETALGAGAEGAGEFDGFVDDGVVGNAIEPEQLVEAEAEECGEGGGRVRLSAFAGDEPVEEGFLAADAIDQFLAEMAIGGEEVCKFPGEEGFDVSGASIALDEDASRNFSWFSFRHASILHVLLRRRQKTYCL